MAWSAVPPPKLLALSLFVQSLSMMTSIIQESSINLPAAEIRQFMNDSFQLHYGQPPDFSLLQTLWGFMMSLYTLGKLLSCFYTSYLAERYGRKVSLFVWTNVFAIAGNCLFIIAKYTMVFELLFLGRLVTGMSAGMTHIVLPLYMTEISPVRFRGLMSTMRGLIAYLLNVIAVALSLPTVLGSAALWPFNLSWNIVFCLIQIMSTSFCPESPSFDLISRRNSKKASVTIQNFFGKEGETPEAIMAALAGIERQQSVSFQKFTPKAVWKSRAIRLGFILAIAIGLERAANGHYAVVSYSTDIIVTAGIDRGLAQYATFFIAVVSAVVCLPVLYLVEKIGRRPLVIYPTAAAAASWFLLAVSRMVPEQEWTKWLGLASILSFIIILPFLESICYFLASELVPQNARSASSALQMVLVSIWGFLQLFLLPVMEVTVPGWSYIILFVVPLVVILGILCLFLPETKGRQIFEIMDELDDRMLQAELVMSCKGAELLHDDESSEEESLLSKSTIAIQSYGIRDETKPVWTMEDTSRLRRPSLVSVD